MPVPTGWWGLYLPGRAGNVHTARGDHYASEGTCTHRSKGSITTGRWPPPTGLGALNYRAVGSVPTRQRGFYPRARGAAPSEQRGLYPPGRRFLYPPAVWGFYLPSGCGLYRPDGGSQCPTGAAGLYPPGGGSLCPPCGWASTHCRVCLFPPVCVGLYPPGRGL
jgi:hypothetical protein